MPRRPLSDQEKVMVAANRISRRYYPTVKTLRALGFVVPDRLEDERPIIGKW